MILGMTSPDLSGAGRSASDTRKWTNEGRVAPTTRISNRRFLILLVIILGVIGGFALALWMFGD
jgi:nitrate reductase NapE component